MRKTLLFICLSIFAISGYAIYYQPSLETSVKLGKNRDIGRSSILIPLWQKEDQLLYFNAIGMMDNKNNQEGNFALGYRHKLNDNILGGYGYYDRKSSTNNNLFHQITLGLELLRENCEFRINGYIPINNKRILKETPKEELPKQIGSQFVIMPFNNQFFEKALGGFDVEGGLIIPQLPINLYLGYYYFDAKDVSTVQGPRLRGEIKLTDWLNITGEVQHDKPRGFNYFVGVELKANLGKKQDKLSILDRKMTQKPVRDIDVVVLEGRERIDYSSDSKEVSLVLLSTSGDLKALSQTTDDDVLNRNYLVTNDIVATKDEEEVLFGPIGGDEHPFTGRFYGGYINEQDEIVINAIKGFNLSSKNHTHVGLFGSLSKATVSHLRLHNTINVFDFSEKQRIGHLAGEATHGTKIFNVGNHGHITYRVAKSLVEDINSEVKKDIVITGKLITDTTIGGLVGTNFDSEINYSYNHGVIDVTLSMGAFASKIRHGGLVDSRVENIEVTGILKIGGLVGHGVRGKIHGSMNQGYMEGNIKIAGFAPDVQGGVIKNIIYVENDIKSELHVGGLIGLTEEKSSITDSYNKANLEFSANSGGFISESRDSLIDGIKGVDTPETDVSIITAMITDGTMVATNNYFYAFDLGGIAGENRNSSIIRTYNVGGIYGSGISNTHLFGIVRSGTVRHCFHAARSSYSAFVSGGLVGINSDGANIDYAYNDGVIDMNSDIVGGLVGLNRSNSTISRSFNMGTISRTDVGIIGGLVGQNDEKGRINQSFNEGNIKINLGNNAQYANSLTVGSLIGWNQEADVTNSYALGDIDIVANNGKVKKVVLGGFIGHHDGGVIKNNYGNANLVITGELPSSYESMDPAIGSFIGNLSDLKPSVINGNFWKKDPIRILSHFPSIGSKPDFSQELGGSISRDESMLPKTFTDADWQFSVDDFSMKLHVRDIWSVLKELNIEKQWKTFTDENFGEIPYPIDIKVAKNYQKYGTLTDNQLAKLRTYVYEPKDQLIEIFDNHMVKKEELSRAQFLLHMFK